MTRVTLRERETAQFSDHMVLNFSKTITVILDSKLKQKQSFRGVL